MAFRWTDDHGQQLVLPLDRQPWEKVGPTTFRVRVMRTGTVYLPDGTPLEIDRAMLEGLSLAPGASFSVVTGGQP